MWFQFQLMFHPSLLDTFISPHIIKWTDSYSRASRWVIRTGCWLAALNTAPWTVRELLISWILEGTVTCVSCIIPLFRVVTVSPLFLCFWRLSNSLSVCNRLVTGHYSTAPEGKVAGSQAAWALSCQSSSAKSHYGLWTRTKLYNLELPRNQGKCRNINGQKNASSLLLNRFFLVVAIISDRGRL